MSDKEIEFIFIVTCIIYLVWILFSKEEISNEIQKYQVYTTWFGKNFHMNVNTKFYVKEVLKWCKTNLGIPSGSTLPKIILHDYKNRNTLGTYNAITNEIFLFLPAHNCLLELTNTIIHEYDHYLKVRGSKGSKRYHQILEKSGYYNHPLEITARATAKLDRLCLEELTEKGLVVKK